MKPHQHPLLSRILAKVTPTSTYQHHWGQLRRDVFPGEGSWDALKAWCAKHNLECELTFSESSKAAQVQFRRLGKEGSIAAEAALPIRVFSIPTRQEADVEETEEAEENEESEELEFVSHDERVTVAAEAAPTIQHPHHR